MSDVYLPDGHAHSWHVENILGSYAMRCQCGWSITVIRDGSKGLVGVEVARALKDAALMARVCPVDPWQSASIPGDPATGAPVRCRAEQRRLDTRVAKSMAKRAGSSAP